VKQKLSEPNREQILKQDLKKEIMRQPGNACEYLNPYDGEPIMANVVRHPSPEVQRILKEYYEEKEAIRKVEAEEEAELKERLKGLPAELKEAIDRHIEPKREGWMEKGESEWVEEIKGQALGTRKDNIRQPILLPTNYNAEAKPKTWDEEVLRACRQMIDPFRYSPETQELAEKFIGQFSAPTEFTASIDEFSCEAGDKVLVIKGTALEFDRVNKNGWAIRKEDSEAVLSTLKGAKLTCDHSGKVRDLVGIVRKAWVEGSKVKFEALLEDSILQKLVKKGRISGVSVGGSGPRICSECGLPSNPKTCKCEGYSIIKNPIVKELSLVLEPAYGEDVAKIEEFEETEEDN